MFIDGYEPSNIVEDCEVFSNKMKELKPYIVKFDENNIMKPKTYPPNYIVGDNYWQSIFVITYNIYIFSTNNSIQKA